jgi:hypothetical protein
MRDLLTYGRHHCFGLGTGVGRLHTSSATGHDQLARPKEDPGPTNESQCERPLTIGPMISRAVRPLQSSVRIAALLASQACPRAPPADFPGPSGRWCGEQRWRPAPATPSGDDDPTRTSRQENGPCGRPLAPGPRTPSERATPRRPRLPTGHREAAGRSCRPVRGGAVCKTAVTLRGRSGTNECGGHTHSRAGCIASGDPPGDGGCGPWSPVRGVSQDGPGSRLKRTQRARSTDGPRGVRVRTIGFPNASAMGAFPFS